MQELIGINPFPTVAKNGHFVILLCLTPDDFTYQRRLIDNKYNEEPLCFCFTFNTHKLPRTAK